MVDNSQDNKRILLMYITRVSGHRQGMIAIQKAIKEINPKAETPAVNGFGYTYPILEKVVNQAYMSVIKATPKIWDLMYDNPNLVKNTRSIKDFLHKTSHDKLGRLLKKHHPDAVVCTQAFPCGMVADYKRNFGLSTKLVGVLTDFAPHSFWINEGVDYYIVPSEDTRDRFIKKGVDPNKIKVFGIPIKPVFSQQIDKKKACEKLGLDPSMPTVLIMGGGQGLGPIKSTVKSLDKSEMKFQIVVLAGNNNRVLKSLKKYTKKTGRRIIALEFIKNVDQYMDASTLIITKPGGITTAECLTKGLPMVIVNSLPGQEMRNSDFLINKGIAIRIESGSDVGEEVELLLKSPERLASMQKAAYQNAKPEASKNIAKLILSLI